MNQIKKSHQKIKEISLKIKRHKKMKNWQFAFNFMKENPLKINDTKTSNSNNPRQFYEKNTFKNERHKKIKYI